MSKYGLHRDDLKTVYGNKYCNTCIYLENCDIALKDFVIHDNWDNTKDYCSRWVDKQESEVEKLEDKMWKLYYEGKTSLTRVAEYILKNYISKEKLLEFIADAIKYTSNVSPTSLIKFINSQTGEE